MIVLDGPWDQWGSTPGPTSLTIGVLDGVHVGHRSLLRNLDSELLRTVLTFEPHPLEVLRPEVAPRLITTLRERIDLLAHAGVECVGTLDLGDIKDLDAAEFVDEILVGKLAMAHIVVGEDFRFGRGRTGDADLLRAKSEEHGFVVEVLEMVDDSDVPISSSRIRALLEEGRVGEANSLLGSRFQLTNEVVDGDKRGRQIGFPTANLRPPSRKVVPGDGVYACYAVIGEERHHAATNIGVRPTFGGGERLIEAFILDFEGDIYGKELTLEFVQYLRPELEFDGVDALVDTMETDVERARGILGSDQSRI